MSVTAVRVLAVFAIGFALAGCSPGGHAPPGAAPPPPATAYDTAVDRIGPDGATSVATALDAFSAAIAPLPGSAVGRQQEPVRSATLAVRMLLRHWDELTPQQRTAALAALGAAAPPASVTPARWAPAALTPARAPTADIHLPCQTSDSDGAAVYRGQTDGIVAELGRRLGHQLRATVTLTVNSKDVEMPALMYTYPCTGGDVADGDPTGCTIHVNPNTVTSGQYDDADRRTMLIHELTHCFLYDMFGIAYASMPDWYGEGVPVWTQFELGGVAGTGFFNQYLARRDGPIYQQSYSAVGFYTHLAETGTDVWRSIRTMGDAFKSGGGNDAAFTASGAAAAFLDSWGAGWVQGRYPGAPWTSGAPHFVQAPKPLVPARLDNNGTVTLTSKAAAANAAQLDVDASVVLVTAGPGASGRLSLGGGADTTIADASPLCTVASCACPADSAAAGTAFRRMTSGQQWLGVTGGTAAATVTLTGFSLPDFCAKPATGCLIGSWVSTNFEVRTGTIGESGGAGVRLRVEASGTVSTVFDGMSPVRFEAADSSGLRGTFTYAGSLAGAITLPAPGATSGPWDLGRAAPSALTATVHVTSPIDYTAGPLDLGSLSGGGGGGTTGAVSGSPLQSGSWTCTGNTLVISPPAGAPVSGVWTLARAQTR